MLVFGATGLVGSQLMPLLQANPELGKVVAATSRIEDAVAVASELDRVRPSRVVHAAGITGRPNIDWCESNVLETTRVNCYGTLNVIDLCFRRGIHVTYFSSGVCQSPMPCVMEFLRTLAGPLSMQRDFTLQHACKAVTGTAHLDTGY